MDNSLINRQAAVDVVRKCNVKEVTPAYMLIDKAEAMTELMMLPSAETEPHWIPCSERLPEEDKEVLVTVYFHGLKQTHPTGWNDHIKPSYYVETASQIGGNWSSVSDEYKVAKNRHEVIAWMPLPEPYKEEGV